MTTTLGAAALPCSAAAPPARIALIDGHMRPNYYAEIRRQLGAEWIELDRPGAAAADWRGVDLAMLSDEFHSDTSVLACAARRAGVPTLHVVDGIVEWRNTWENPRSLSPARGMPLFQPVLADKIACLGRGQARVLEAWGNVGRCEVVGAPRFDKLLGRQARLRAADEPWTVLVMTAKTAGFNELQLAHARRALQDLQAWSQRNVLLNGQAIRFVWRVTTGLEEALGLGARREAIAAGDLADVLARVDAVISTPSTAMLEAMLQGVPVALLDYNNCPHFVPAAWSITASEHIESVLRQLIDPPPEKRHWQDAILHDQLACATPATPRLAKLIETMVRSGRESRAQNQPLQLPARILEDRKPVESAAPFPMLRFHPRHDVFSQTDIARLQAEVGHLRLALEHAQSREREANDRNAKIKRVPGVRLLLSLSRRIKRLCGGPVEPKL